MRHILTFDIEHWYESWRQRGLGGYDDFDDCDSPVLLQLLDLLDETGRKATFFFTGRFIREFPSLGKECLGRGHEVASHSDQHTLLGNLHSFAQIREDLIVSVDSIEQATGQKVLGYRAPKWSLPEEAEKDFFQSMADLGLEYDSSFFSTRRVARERLFPHQVMLANGKSITELPASALRFGPVALPCGGAYFRLFPLFLTRLMLYQCRKAGYPAVFYAHPYDLNPSCHMVPGTGLVMRWMRTVGVSGALGKLKALLEKHEFAPMVDWVKQHKAELPCFNISEPTA